MHSQHHLIHVKLSNYLVQQQAVMWDPTEQQHYCTTAQYAPIS